MRVDAIVLGAGPAGCGAAARLAAAGAIVALLDRPKTKEHKIGESLSPLVTQLLRAVGMAEAFDSSRHMISSGVRTAWGGPVQERSFLASPYGDGWLLDRPTFDLGLREFSLKSGAIVVEGSRICSVARSNHHYHFQLATESEVTSLVANWVLDCSGRSAIFAVRHGAKRIKHDNLVAFWRTYKSTFGETDEDRCTTIENADSGWYYTTPIPSGRRVVVFLTDGDLAACAMALKPSLWQQMLNATTVIRNLVDKHRYEPVSRVRGISASSVQLDRPFGFHWVAAGDAAVAFDPLSSQGIGGAIVSGSNAAGAVLEEHAGHEGAFAAYAEDSSKSYSQYLRELARRYQIVGASEGEFWARRSASFSSQER